MNEIEKLYENAGIEIPIARLKIFKDDNGEIFTQPPFTAEKQIKIENVILRNENNYRRWIEYSINAHGKWVVEFMNNSGINITVLEETREKAFINMINSLWKNLTSEQKRQIKEILE